MGKQSTRENKTIYQLCREAAGLTRAEASERMDAVSDSQPPVPSELYRRGLLRLL